MSPQPIVSVIMPAYNTRPELLRASIESVLNQTFTNFELLIFDDNSDAYLKDIIESYTDKRIKYFRNPQSKNWRQARGRNFLIEKSRGKYLAILDSDDTCMPQRFARQVEFMEKNPDVGLCGTRATINNTSQLHVPDLEPGHENLFKWTLFRGCAFCNSTVMLRKSVIKETGARYRTDAIPAEDAALYCDLIGKTKFALIDEILCNYNFYDTNASSTQYDLQCRNEAFARLGALERLYKIKIADKDKLVDVLTDQDQDSDIKLSGLNQYVNLLLTLPLSDQDKQYAIKMPIDKYRLLCYHTHSLSKQWRLMHSPLRKIGNIPLWWSIFCLVTRGIF